MISPQKNIFVKVCENEKNVYIYFPMFSFQFFLFNVFFSMSSFQCFIYNDYFSMITSPFFLFNVYISMLSFQYLFLCVFFSIYIIQYLVSMLNVNNVTFQCIPFYLFSYYSDMQKHPSSLARLVEIFFCICGKVSKRLPLLCEDIRGKWRKLR